MGTNHAIANSTEFSPIAIAQGMRTSNTSMGIDPIEIDMVDQGENQREDRLLIYKSRHGWLVHRSAGNESVGNESVDNRGMDP